MNKPLDRYAVFGNPISHSKSPLLHKTFAEQTKQPILYDSQCIDTNNFITSVDNFFTQGGKGLNITVPFKEEAFAYAKKLTQRAKCAEAVNTFFLDKEKNIVGDNTDGVGLVTDMIDNLSWKIKNKTILIVGAGGAVKGIIEPLIEKKPTSIMIVNRTVEKAKNISRNFNHLFPITATSFSELTNTPFDIIINGTSASLAGELPPLPSHIINSDTCCYDMMYEKNLTPFLTWAQQCGSKNLSDGLGMLVGQGAESFFIWRGVRPNTKPVISLLRKNL